MLKLIRNRLGTDEILFDGDGKAIEWRYFVELENYRLERNVVTHKLTKKHIQWDKNKMNVKLATELFSKSVADSFEYLRKHNFDGFANCEGTVELVRTSNDLFDIFNSKGIGDKTPFKNAISQTNAAEIFEYLDKAYEYLKSMKIGDRSIFKTRKATGFKGYLINIHSIRCAYEMYVQTGLLEYLPTYQMSQDGLESLFGRVRSLNGM